MTRATTSTNPVDGFAADDRHGPTLSTWTEHTSTWTTTSTDAVEGLATDDRRGAARRTRPNERCAGQPGVPCTWHTHEAGAAARLQRGQQRCPLCCRAHMQALHRTTRGQGALTARYRQLLALRSTRALDLWTSVEAYLGAEARQHYERRLAPTTCPGRPGVPCTWHTHEAGAAARLQRGQQRCPLCCRAHMQALHRTTRGQGALTARFRQLLALRSTRALDLWTSVEAYLGAEARQHYERRLAPTTCPGRPGAPCTWHTHQAGAAAGLQRGQHRCPLCCQAHMQALHGTTKGKHTLATRLKQLLALRSTSAPDLWSLVAKHLGAEARQYYERRLAPATCPGRPGAPCTWHTTQAGAAAKVKPLTGEFYCPLCSHTHMQALHGTARGKGAIALRLSQLLALQPQHAADVWACVEANLGQEGGAYYQARTRAREPLPGQWAEALQRRYSVHPLPDEEGRRLWRERARADARKRDKKFGLAFSAEHSGRAWMSARARQFEFWSMHASWFMCTECHRLEPRPFHQSSHEKNAQLRAVQKKCKHCAHGIGYRAPTITDIPEPLRDLTAAALWALRPIEIDVGAYQRGEYGYRIHTDMTRLRWRPQSVRKQLATLRGEDLHIAQQAWRFLHSRPLPSMPETWAEHTRLFRLHPGYSAYLSFVAQHDRFLDMAGPRLDKTARRLPVRFLETLGLETALWPHLYPAVALCETFVRLEDGRRLARERSDVRAAYAQRQRAGQAAGRHGAPAGLRARDAGDVGAEQHHSDEEEDEDSHIDSDAEDNGVDDGNEDREDDAESPLHFLKESDRQSLKASFLAKVTSAVIGYASDYELAQFVYDLWLWSALGGAKHASGVQMRVALAGKPFSPEYWRTRHFALLDLQKQLGYPTLFVTIAPYEWSSPYHAFLEDELLRTFKTRLHLPGPESFHLAHILTQAALGLVTGWNKQGRGGWARHVLGDQASAGQGSVLNLFGRIEFQDGKRKRGARNERLDYHGSGRPHVHFLVWLRHPQSLPWSQIVCGHLPADNAPLEQIVRSSQFSWTGSGWPRRDASTAWDETAQRLELHHPESAWEEGMRAYMPDVLASLKCHMDVQASDGRGMLLRYVAGYVPKFSDSFQSNWLDDLSSDYALARRVLTQYQPLEPEMWLQLSAHLFRQCFAGGGLSRFVVPVPWRDILPERVQQYMGSSWRPDSMCLLAYLRKTNKRGGIHRDYKKSFAALAVSEGLGPEDWIHWLADAHYSGAVLVAAVMKSRFNDEYYKQWCLLHVPFRELKDLWHAKLELLPPQFHGRPLRVRQKAQFAAAFLMCVGV